MLDTHTLLRSALSCQLARAKTILVLTNVAIHQTGHISIARSVSNKQRPNMSVRAAALLPLSPSLQMIICRHRRLLHDHPAQTSLCCQRQL